MSVFLSEVLFLSLTALYCAFVSSCVALDSTIVHQSSEFERFNKSCLPWKYDKYHNSSCECGVGLQGVVECSNTRSSVLVLTCHCMSYSDQNDDMLVVGTRMYLCNNVYYSEVSEHTDLNNLCNFFVQQNRKDKCVAGVSTITPLLPTLTFKNVLIVLITGTIGSNIS